MLSCYPACPCKMVEFLGSKEICTCLLGMFWTSGIRVSLPLWSLTIASILSPWSCFGFDILKSWKYRDGCPWECPAIQGRFTFRTCKLCSFKILAFRAQVFFWKFSSKIICFYFLKCFVICFKGVSLGWLETPATWMDAFSEGPCADCCIHDTWT